MSTFAKYHPGGKIIEKFMNSEATSTFYGMHRNPEKILKRFKPIAINRDSMNNESLTKDYLKLHARYTDKGVFTPDYHFFILTTSINTCIFALTLLAMYLYPENSFTNGMCYGIFQINAAGMTHDSGHM